MYESPLIKKCKILTETQANWQGSKLYFRGIMVDLLMIAKPAETTVNSDAKKR